MYKNLREHILKLFDANTRLDGRKYTDYRPVKVDVNVTFEPPWKPSDDLRAMLGV